MAEVVFAPFGHRDTYGTSLPVGALRATFVDEHSPGGRHHRSSASTGKISLKVWRRGAITAMLVREICMATMKDRIGSDLRHFELSETVLKFWLKSRPLMHWICYLCVRMDRVGRLQDMEMRTIVVWYWAPGSFQAHVPKATHPTNCDCGVQPYRKNADSKDCLAADLTVKVSSGYLSRSPWRCSNEDINGMWRGIPARSQSLPAIDGKEKKLLRKACVEHGGAVG